MSSENIKKIVICGASGLIGTSLVALLRQEGHEVVVVGRDANKLQASFAGEVEALTWEQFARYDASEIETIVNLSGASVGDKRWTDDYKKVMYDSRIDSTRECVEITKRNPKIHLVNASAVSAYGFYFDNDFEFAEGDEVRRSGNSYLQELIDDWEAEALKANEHGSRVTLIRLGVVLDRFGGSLPKMMQPFKFYFGGPVGAGKQIMSWIGVRDAVRSILFLIHRGNIVGPVNLVSPAPCTQDKFAKALGKAMGKPSAVRLSTPMARLMMGQFGLELVLKGQRVKPGVLLDNGFDFNDHDISVFLEDQFSSLKA